MQIKYYIPSLESKIDAREIKLNTDYNSSDKPLPKYLDLDLYAQAALDEHFKLYSWDIDYPLDLIIIDPVGREYIYEAKAEVVPRLSCKIKKFNDKNKN